MIDEKFIVTSLKVNGEDKLEEFGQREFYSKWDFRDTLSPFIERNYGEKVTDVDTAQDFGEEGDGIFVATTGNVGVEATGGYVDLQDTYTGDDDYIELERLGSKEALGKVVKKVLNESTTLKYKGHSFVLNVKANSDPTKDGLGVTLVPPFGDLTPTEQSDITTDILQRLNDGLGKYGLVASIDTQLKDKSKIAYFIYTDNFKKLIRKALQSSNKSNVGDEQPEAEQQSGEQQNL